MEQVTCSARRAHVRQRSCPVSLVDFTEFMLAIALTQSGDLDERLALAFDMYDYNNSGTSKARSLARRDHAERLLVFSS